MKLAAERVVLDTSIAIKWFIDEIDSGKALAILEDVLKNPARYFVPELFYFELANAINRLIEDDADPRLILFQRLFDIGLNRVVLDKQLSVRLRYFQSLGLSAYDGSYIAIAEGIGGVWITADGKAHAKVKKSALSVLLADLL